MRCDYSCGSEEHLLHRRQFLGGLTGAGVVGGLGALATPASAKELASQQRRVLVINMAGGLSQLESWDPKPGVKTGGPFRAIPTSVPGVHISELLPKTASQMHHLAIVRSINTKENDHGKGRYAILHGRRQTPAASYPVLGAVAAKALSPEDNSLPGHIRITGGSGGRGNDSAYLGPRFASISLGNGKPPRNLDRVSSLSEASDQRRNLLRSQMNDRFATKRRTAQTDAYTYNFEQARKLMDQKEVFDISHEKPKDIERYGEHDLGKQCLLARRLLEHGVTFVQVSHSNYDTHNENFTFHYEQLGEFDSAFSCLVSDLAERGMLESTLVVVLSEFGRTPRINARYGRDHWGTAWSVCMGGGRVQPGAVIGATNKEGTAVSDREVDHGHLFHTYLQAVGLDSFASFDIGGRPMPMADPAAEPINELLS